MAAINARCFITQQTIAEGDPCRLIAIGEQATYSALDLQEEGRSWELFGIAHTSVDPNCLWAPMSGFLPAVYDDYGMTQLKLDTPQVRATVLDFLDELYRSALRTGAGKNPCHDLAFDFPAFTEKHASGIHALLHGRTWRSRALPELGTELDNDIQACWSHLSDRVRRHRVFINRNVGAPRPLELAIVHEQAYQAVRSFVDAQTDWDNNSWAPADALRRTLPDVRQWVDEYSQESTRPATPALKAFYFAERLNGLLERYNRGSSLPLTVPRRALRQLADALYQDNPLDDEAFIAQAVELMQDIAVVFGMAWLQVTFAPMTFNGSDDTNRVGRAYADLVSSVSKKVSAERKAVAKARGC